MKFDPESRSIDNSRVLRAIDCGCLGFGSNEGKIGMTPIEFSYGL
jgi:hypothetical protein